MWLHVDAAYAGVVALIPARRDTFEGWGRADSIVVNPHKWLFTPLDASLLLTPRMKDLRAAFSLVPEYLRTLDREGPVRDYNEYQPQLGRRFRALKLWIQLRWFGLDGLRRRIERHIAMAHEFAGWIDDAPDWERLAPVPFSTVCFRWNPGSGIGEEQLDARNAADHRPGEPHGRGLPLAHASGRPVHDPIGGRQPAHRGAPRRARMGTAARGSRRMSPAPKPRDVRFLSSPEELRHWFDANHETADELWLGQYKKSAGRPTISWSEAVDEALCVGWIDGVRYSLGDDRFAQRFTPRRKGSNWSAINVQKVADLSAQGRMRPAGLAAFEARTPEKTAVYSYEREAAAFSTDEESRLRAHPAAWADWERRPPSYRRAVTHWVTSAKKPETRARRLEQLIVDSAAGRPVGPMRPRRGR